MKVNYLISKVLLVFVLVITYSCTNEDLTSETDSVIVEQQNDKTKASTTQKPPPPGANGAITFPPDGYQTAYSVNVLWNTSLFTGTVDIEIYEDSVLQESKTNYSNTGSYLVSWYDGEIDFRISQSNAPAVFDFVIFDLYLD